MEDLAVFTVLNHSGSFGKNFVELKKKKCYLPAKVGPYGEKLFFFFRTEHSQGFFIC